MRRATVLACSMLFLAAPCGAASFSMGNASGYPGEQVSVPVSLRGASQASGFDFGVAYERGILSLSGSSLGGAATAAGINRLEVNENSPGNIDVSGGISETPPEFRNVDGTVVNLKFTISSSAAVGSSGRVGFSGSARYEISGTSSASASTGGPGSVSVTEPPTPLPSGAPPEVDLSMVSPLAIVPGQHAILEYRIRVQDPSWEGVPSDAYLGVVPPTGGLLYIESGARFDTERSSIAREFEISDIDGEIDFGPLPAEYPKGVYSFYGVLAWSGGNPLKGSERITDLADTHFEFLPAPTATPVPTPTTTPTPTP